MEQGATAVTSPPDAIIDPCWHLISCSKSCYRMRAPGTDKIRDIESITVQIKLRNGRMIRVPLPSVDPDDPPDMLWLTEEARRRFYANKPDGEPPCTATHDVEYVEGVNGTAQSAS